MANPIRVVIVDDSRSIRSMIRVLLSKAEDITVVGEAADPFEARNLIKQLKPDVITLDVVMPRMDGLSFLERLMQLNPMPVVMISSKTSENSKAAVRALSLGAVDCVDLAEFGNWQDFRVDLPGTVRLAANAKQSPKARATPPSQSKERHLAYKWNGKFVAIGSSTGGVEALLNILGNLPANGPPILIAQHMPESFLGSFAQRLNDNSAMKVSVATDGKRLEAGNAYVAPGGSQHLGVRGSETIRLAITKDTGNEVYVPSVNHLFSTIIPQANRFLAVILTGMGNDGADAMLSLRKHGALTIAQDGDTSVVDGMPKSARELGAVAEVYPLSRIANAIIKHTNLRAVASA